MDPHTEQPRHLSLFSGAGGGEYAAKLLGWRTVCYVEREPYCQRVIQARIADGIFDDAPIWGDVATFDGKPGRLNPSFVEWMMAWPIGASACEPLETDRFRSWLQQHSDYFTQPSQRTDDE